ADVGAIHAAEVGIQAPELDAQRALSRRRGRNVVGQQQVLGMSAVAPAGCNRFQVPAFEVFREEDARILREALVAGILRGDPRLLEQGGQKQDAHFCTSTSSMSSK